MSNLIKKRHQEKAVFCKPKILDNFKIEKFALSYLVSKAVPLDIQA